MATPRKSSNVHSAGASTTPMRFMQMALAMTMFFGGVYIYQFASWSEFSDFTSRMSFGNWTEIRHRNYLIGQRKFLVESFSAAHKFVSEYDTSIGPMYMLFVSDTDENGTYWCPDCEDAIKPIYDAFERAPRNSKIVEIRVGNRAHWKDFENEFRQNQLFYIDYIPTLMRYDGGGNSSAMLTEKLCLDPDLLDYVFRVPNPAAGSPKNNKIITINDAKALMKYMDNYDNSYPLFVFFLSAKHSFNGRLWCPYCDKADVAVMHYYNYTAPANAVLLRTIVAESYKEWKSVSNPFKSAKVSEKLLTLRGIPYLGRVKKDMATNKVSFNEFLPEFHAKSELVQFYQDP